jgi:hypothetical protein
LEESYNKFLEHNFISSSLNISNCEKSVWEATFYSKNSLNTFCCNAVENSINIFNIWDKKEDHNINLINSVEAWTNCENFVWVCSVWTNTYNIFFSISTVESNNIYYSIDIEWCDEVMWSIWLRNKKYCIFNK